MEQEDLEARVAALYAALRRPRPVVLLARDPAEHARLTLAAARRPFGGFAVLALAMGGGFSAMFLMFAFTTFGGPLRPSQPLVHGLVLAAMNAWMSFVPFGNATPYMLRLVPPLTLLLAAALAGLALGGPLGLGLGVLAAAQLWFWAGILVITVGPVWSRWWLRRRRDGPPLLGGVTLQTVVRERLRHAVEGLRAPPGTSPALPEPTAAEQEAGRRVRLLLERGAGFPLLSHELEPSLGRGVEDFRLHALRRAAGAAELPTLAARAAELDRDTLALTLLEGCAVVLPATAAPDRHRHIDPAAALYGLLAPSWLVWLVGRLPAAPALRRAAWALEREPDPALRQEMAERLGPAKVFAALKRKPVAEDERGVLFSLGPEPQPTLFVRVADQVVGPDGAAQEHWLPVPPHVASAKEAVAWTFGRASASYAPDLET